MNKNELARRYAVFVIALWVTALGVSLITRSVLGTSPISSIPYVVSLSVPMTMGSIMVLLNMLLIIGQMLMLGGKGIKANKVDLVMQIPVSLLFGLFIDANMALLAVYQPQWYMLKICSLIIGCLILALGICLEVAADVTMISGEYFVRIASKRFNREFGQVKIMFDVSLVVLAVILSLILSGHIDGVREGTIIVALLTGPFVKLLAPYLKFVTSWETGGKVTISTEQVPLTVDQAPIVITIAREYGSGGHDIGKRIADDLGIKYYDNQLIALAAQESGMTESDITAKEQSINPNLLMRMVMQDYEAPIEKSLSSSDSLFVATNRVIRRVAQQGDCVIVGRCSDWILRDMPNCVNIFIHANMDYKVKRAIASYGLKEATAVQEIERINKARAAHYQHYTGKRWNDINNYHLTCDTSRISSEQVCVMIEALYNERKASVTK